MIALAATAFTLSWSHSVERTSWQEQWQLTEAGLQLITAQVKGSGAGIDPPEDAVLEDGWWKYTPTIGPLPQLILAASGATMSGWSLCTQDSDPCLMLGVESAAPIVIEPCPD